MVIEFTFEDKRNIFKILKRRRRTNLSYEQKRVLHRKMMCVGPNWSVYLISDRGQFYFRHLLFDEVVTRNIVLENSILVKLDLDLCQYIQDDEWVNQIKKDFILKK